MKGAAVSATRAWLGLATLTLPLFVLALDVSVLFLASPRIAAALAPTDVEMLWIMDVYGFLIAGFLVPMGNLGDRIGRRRLLMIGATAFAAASVLAAFAPGAGWLIAARAVLGVAGATLMPSTLALISALFRDPRRRATAIGIWMATFSAGVALGPIIGGVLLERFWWGAVFLLAVPVMAVLVIVAPVLLPETRDPAARPIDVASVALLLGALIPLVWALKEIAAGGAPAGVLAALLAGGAAGWLFLRRQARSPAPLVDLALFRGTRFRVAISILLLGILAANGVNYLYPQVLQTVHGLSPLAAGLWTVPVAAAAVLASVVAPWLAGRIGAMPVLAVGSVVATGGFALVAWAASGGGLGMLVPASMLTVAGLAPLGVLTTDLVVGSAPDERAGAAAALSETSGELGVGLGVAIAGSAVLATGSLTNGLVIAGIGGAALALLLGALSTRLRTAAP